MPLVDKLHRGFSIMASMVTVAREPQHALSLQVGEGPDGD